VGRRTRQSEEIQGEHEAPPRLTTPLVRNDAWFSRNQAYVCRSPSSSLIVGRYSSPCSRLTSSGFRGVPSGFVASKLKRPS
jgi:hypothetical protein